MTLAREMNQCLESLRSIQSSLSTLVMLSQREESKQALYDAIIAVKHTEADVQKRAEACQEK